MYIQTFLYPVIENNSLSANVKLKISLYEVKFMKFLDAFASLKKRLKFLFSICVLRQRLY